MRLPLLILFACFATGAHAADQLICCGAGEVFIIPADARNPAEKDRTWRWTAADSPEIPEPHRARFRSTDDCKPLGPYILITSSSDGVALIRRKDKRCVFFTLVRNAHSGCLLPGKRVAVAASFGGDELRVFDQRTSAAELKPLARIALRGAHGAWWDARRKRLWALGSDVLLRLELRGQGQDTQLVEEQRWNLPTAGGHDLSPAGDRALYVTTNTHVYRFDREAGKFAPYKPLADQSKVKSVDEHPNGQVVYHQGADGNWWSDTIRFAGSDRVIRLAGERLYKVRWEMDRGLPE